jgi:hypothetical protein
MVSIHVAASNISGAVSSSLDQFDRHFERITGGDASSDNSLEIVKPLGNSQVRRFCMPDSGCAITFYENANLFVIGNTIVTGFASNQCYVSGSSRTIDWWQIH